MQNKDSISKLIAQSEASFLMSGLIWQENVLQSYRIYLIVSQSVLLTIGTFLFGFQIFAETGMGRSLFGSTFILSALIALLTSLLLGRAISERRASVDWWQRRLLEYEDFHTSTRHFTSYRKQKNSKYNKMDDEQLLMNKNEIESLFRPGTPKARIFLKAFVVGVFTIWVGFFILMLLLTTYP